MKVWEYKAGIQNGRFWFHFEIKVEATNAPTASYRATKEIMEVAKNRRPRWKQYSLELLHSYTKKEAVNATD